MLSNFEGYGSPQTRRGLGSPYGPPVGGGKVVHG
jgi:hypothetical protein